MQLDWVVDYSQNKLTFEIDNLRYETVDGGQNIYKYQDGKLVQRLRQYPDHPEDYVQPYNPQPPEAPLDEWLTELEYLIETYPQLGEKHFVKTYRERDGSITTENFVRGMGVNNLDDLISVNRLGQPASIQEKWDWDELASVANVDDIPRNMFQEDENLQYAHVGIGWYRHKKTGIIERAGSSQNCPCHVFPKIYPPTEIHPDDLYDDIAKYGGTRHQE